MVGIALIIIAVGRNRSSGGEDLQGGCRHAGLRRQGHGVSVRIRDLDIAAVRIDGGNQVLAVIAGRAGDRDGLPDTEAVEGTIDGVVGIVVDGNSIAAGKFKVGLRGVAESGVGAARDGDRGGIGVGIRT